MDLRSLAQGDRRPTDKYPVGSDICRAAEKNAVNKLQSLRAVTRQSQAAGRGRPQAFCAVSGTDSQPRRASIRSWRPLDLEF